MGLFVLLNGFCLLLACFFTIFYAFLFLMRLGCVELLLETIHPFLLGSSPLLSYTLKIVEVLGAYRYDF